MTGIEFAVIALAGVLIGRFLPNRRKRNDLKPIKPICGCKHHLSYHDPATGRCRNGDWGGCACRQYSGPQPLPEYFAPEMTS